MSRLARPALALGVAVGIALWLAPERPPSGQDSASSEPAHTIERIEITAIELPKPEPKQAPAPEPTPPPQPTRTNETPPKQTLATALDSQLARPRPPRPPAPPSQPVEARTVIPGGVELARGRALLEAGAFPRLRASYARIGFARYRDAVLALGGGFFLFDRERRQTVARLDPRTGATLEEKPDPTLSRWPRDVTRHLKNALEEGRSRYGSRVSRVILLPPAELDAALLGGLESALRAEGLEPAQLVRVDVAYELVDGRLHGSVLALGFRDGTELPLELAIDLSVGVST